MLKHQSVLVLSRKASLLSLPASLTSTDSGRGTIRKISLDNIAKNVPQNVQELSDDSQVNTKS